MGQAFKQAKGACTSQFSAGVAQLVELLPSKQNVASSSLVSRSKVLKCHEGPDRKSQFFDVGLSSAVCAMRGTNQW